MCLRWRHEDFSPSGYRRSSIGISRTIELDCGSMAGVGVNSAVLDGLTEVKAGLAPGLKPGLVVGGFTLDRRDEWEETVAAVAEHHPDVGTGVSLGWEPLADLGSLVDEALVRTREVGSPSTHLLLTLPSIPGDEEVVDALAAAASICAAEPRCSGLGLAFGATGAADEQPPKELTASDSTSIRDAWAMESSIGQMAP